ncbi:MAG TPA: cyclic pyranopterin monophosphate synthase MoaC [Nitrospiraceae bacterium]|jgi:cyclic pyranopterin phosphate synthase|nr:cyclic pyranopterin monophosphate synthase MoaC [Nitrospiraceae bacterium]
MKELSHLDKEGKVRMVDVSEKSSSKREAVARGSVHMKPETIQLIMDNAIAKGDVISVAKIAGIMAAKKTSELVPLCHPLNVTTIVVEITVEEARSVVDVEATVKTFGQTGVEMEALTAVSVAALTIYDMCKAVDKEMFISDIMLMEKRGGKSGEFNRK